MFVPRNNPRGTTESSQGELGCGNNAGMGLQNPHFPVKRHQEMLQDLTPPGHLSWGHQQPEMGEFDRARIEDRRGWSRSREGDGAGEGMEHRERVREMGKGSGGGKGLRERKGGSEGEKGAQREKRGSGGEKGDQEGPCGSAQPPDRRGLPGGGQALPPNKK